MIPFVVSDGSVLIFTSSGRKDSFGKGDLYWTTNVDSVWLQADHFDKYVNTATRDFCPYITDDKKYFFYSSESDVKFIPLEQLPTALTSVLKRK